jgi:hypothetical protein
MKNILEIVKAKRDSTESERIRQELAYNQSSDYSTPPSIKVASLEGQVLILDWVIRELETNE